VSQPYPTDESVSRASTPAAHAGWRVVVRHQLGAAAGTLVDFVTMIACVRLGLTPVAGTAIGAGGGAIVNFSLSRHWIFPSKIRGRIRQQAIRYALVSFGSLCLNTLGELLVHDGLGVQFILARILVAGALGLGWNYPLHRGWVFAPTTTRTPARS
jgi:putative flippase GtrA